MKDLVAKILSPTRPLKASGRVFWVRQNIPYSLQLKAELFQQEILGEFRFFGMLRRSQILSLLGDPPTQDLANALNNAKLDLYKKYPDSFLTKNARKEIEAINKRFGEIIMSQAQLDCATLEYYAEKRAAIFILEQLTKEPYDTCEFLFYDGLKQGIGISKIRKIARSDYWHNLWRARNPFKYYPLTDEQITLSYYSNLYKNILKHPECPTTDILEDDDLLDGWLISQSKQNKKKTSYGSKIDSSKEIFVMAQNQDHANEIYGGNSDEARAIQNVRMKQLKNNKSVHFGKFADVQRERMIQNAAR